MKKRFDIKYDKINLLLLLITLFHNKTEASSFNDT